jgi:enamine deaminase RidA (YjgF/YER057c/UK114 family)
MNPRKLPMANSGAGSVRHGYLSNAVRVEAGPLLFVSGQVAWDRAFDVVAPGDGAGQARQVFSNLKAVLAEYGADLSDVVRVTVYVTSLSWFDELAKIREELFPGDGPASTIIEVSSLVDPELLIEVDAVAAIN